MISYYTKSQKKAFDKLMTGTNIFITGKPGTGKTELVRDFTERIRIMGKKVAMTAATGIAASSLNGGRTLHSFLKWNRKTKGYDYEWCSEALSKVNVIVVDEVSMLSEEIMAHFNKCLSLVKHEPQIIMVGDFFQLPPVKSIIYPFESRYWDEFQLMPCILEDVVRQQDEEFKYMLELAMLGDKRCIRYFNEATAHRKIDGAITLCTRNDFADEINLRNMELLPGSGKPFFAEGSIKEADFRNSRIEKCFVAKKNMRVMVYRNDPGGRFQNGSLGTIISMDDEDITVAFDNGNTVQVSRVDCEVPNINKKKNPVIVKQFPLMGGYAISIHKSQGQTFDTINIKAPRCWDPGQLYVALSRAKTVSGIYLYEDIVGDNLITDPRVLEYYRHIIDRTAA